MWLYELELSAPVDAATIEQAWVDQFSAATATVGTNVVGTTAVIASQARVSGYETFSLPELDSITELREVAALADGDALDSEGQMVYRGGGA